MKLRAISAWLLLVASPFARAGDDTKPPVLYPFIRDGKWGYVDAGGAWVIEPRFGRCVGLFQGDRVRVWEGDKWGYIDRSGKWIVGPKFNKPCPSDETAAFQVACIGKKQGILAPDGSLVLPAKYDRICTFGNQAWVLSGEKLGLFALDGRWILKPSMEWPSGRKMPIPTDGDVSWFKRGEKWGLLSPEGRVLFSPRFAEHVMGRWDLEDWDHPEGLDFKNGRAWVRVGKEFQLITDDGRVLTRKRFQHVRRWANDVYIFTQQDENSGLISKEGEILLPGKYSTIGPPSEGVALISEHKSGKGFNGETIDWWNYGFIDEQGKIIIATGTYSGGNLTELLPFSGGLTPARIKSPDGNDSRTAGLRAGYIDKTGTPVIEGKFYSTGPFSEGLGEISMPIPGREPHPYYYDYHWGYVDKTGAYAIKPQFGWTSPFCRDRAWVLKPGAKWDEPEWAMIDRTGKVLTGFVFNPPERENRWEYSTGFGDKTEWLRHTRWRGDLAVISRGDSHGLATAEGRILVEPIFKRIGDFHDGVAVAEDTRQLDANGNVKVVTALVTGRGEIFANDTYTLVKDFDHGAAWATHRFAAPTGHYTRQGWGMIDTAAKEISELKYIRAHWVSGNDAAYVDDGCPRFYDELAPVALVDGYQPYGKSVWLLNSWGYINRAGKIVAWHQKDSE